MKQLIKNAFSVRALTVPRWQAARCFSKSGHNNGEYFEETEQEMKSRKEMIERERAHFDSLSDKDKHYYQAFRLSLVKSIEESWSDKNNWWNKLQTLTNDDIDSLPDEYIRKFGTYIVRTQENQLSAKQEINKDFDIYNQVRNLNEIKTGE